MWTPDLGRMTGPRYRAIADAVAEDIAAGRLKPGDRLPTHRALAYEIGVTVGTVTRAYQEATRRGLLTGEVGRGSFVRGERKPDGFFSFEAQPGRVNMGFNRPTILPEDAAAIRNAMLEVAQRDDFAATLQYPTSRIGSRQAKQEVALWLRHHRLEVESEDVHIVAGGQNAIATAVFSCVGQGDLIAVEEQTWPSFRSTADAAGARLLPVPVDRDGMVPEELDRICAVHRPRAIFTIPTLQNPTTTTMPTARRQAIAEIAERHDALIVEDDVYGALKPDAPPPLLTFAPDRTVYLTSVSKSIAPSLRVGMMVVPAALHARLSVAIHTLIWMASPILVETFRTLVRSGAADDILARHRQHVRLRNDLARRKLGNAAGGSDPDAMNLWFPLPEGWTSGEFVEEARRLGVDLIGSETFAADPRQVADRIRICLGSPQREQDLERGLDILAEMLRRGPGAPIPVM